MSANSEQFIYQANAYYGIHYPAELIDTVLEVCKKTGYTGLYEESAEHVIAGKYHLFASTNSDRPGQASRGFIFVDEFTFGGPDCDSAEDCYVHTEPTEQTKREINHPLAVDGVINLYNLIVVEYKRKKIKITRESLHFGWSNVVCCWGDGSTDDESEDTSESSPEPETKPEARPAETPKKVKAKPEAKLAAKPEAKPADAPKKVGAHSAKPDTTAADTTAPRKRAPKARQ